MVYQELFKTLNESHNKYLVVGGMEVSLHGIPRSTYHINKYRWTNDSNGLKNGMNLFMRNFTEISQRQNIK
ncbi:MAG: hypothetical protein QME58_08185 [Bacteroidota bacterium]|nr:hypothetical protein [Bacteroidota bacterium]